MLVALQVKTTGPGQYNAFVDNDGADVKTRLGEAPTTKMKDHAVSNLGKTFVKALDTYITGIFTLIGAIVILKC